MSLPNSAFGEATDDGGEFNVMAAGESGVFSSVRTGLGAGGRPSSSDGLATFGGVRALARYVKIEAVPASGGQIVINEVSWKLLFAWRRATPPMRKFLVEGTCCVGKSYMDLQKKHISRQQCFTC